MGWLSLPFSCWPKNDRDQADWKIADAAIAQMKSLPPKDGLEGHSLAPQLKDPQTPRPWPAVTSHNQGNDTVRMEHWRYIRYADGSEELYDHRKDPNLSHLGQRCPDGPTGVAGSWLASA